MNVNMRTDLSSIPVIDAHCHPFPAEQIEITPQQLRDAVSVALRGPTPPENETMLLSRMVVKQLARLLGCEPTWDAAIAARNSTAREGIAKYHRLLFDDARIAMLLADPGYPAEPFISAERFQTVIPCPVIEGYRIERFIPRETFRNSGFTSFVDFVDAFKIKLDEEAARPGVRFFKSVIAYITGLAIRRIPEAEALAAWAERPGAGDPGDKVLRDYLFWVTAMKAKEHNLAFQLHTGHTSNYNPWPNVNPILLSPILNEPEMQDVRLVLVHGGYPYCTEAGYLTSVFPNLSLDLSLMIPWSSIGIAKRIEETLESAPTSKVMYGSDGIHVPELFWISAINTRRALGRVLDGLIDDGVIDGAEAMEIGRDILYRNAERIYGVSIGLA